MAKLNEDDVRKLSDKYVAEEDETLDIRNVLEFSESAIGAKEIDGSLWQYRLRETNFGIGQGLGREIQQLPIVSADLKKKIQEFKNKSS